MDEWIDSEIKCKACGEKVKITLCIIQEHNYDRTVIDEIWCTGCGDKTRF